MSVAVLLQLLGPLIPVAIQWVQKKFGAGGGEVGKVKLDTVLGILHPAVEALVSSGAIDRATADSLEAAIEATLSALKATGVIPPGTTPTVPTVPIPTVVGSTFTFTLPPGVTAQRYAGGVMFLPISGQGT